MSAEWWCTEQAEERKVPCCTACIAAEDRPKHAARTCAGHPCREGRGCANPWCPFGGQADGS